MKDWIRIDGVERHVRDVMNPRGMYSGGIRQREYSTTNDPLPTSGRLIPEFFGRRNIRDMFTRKPSSQPSQGTTVAKSTVGEAELEPTAGQCIANEHLPDLAVSSITQQAKPARSPLGASKRRSASDISSNKSSKRTKNPPAPSASPATGKGQQSLKGFFKPKATDPTTRVSTINEHGSSEKSNHGGSVASSFQSLAGEPTASVEAQEEKQILELSASGTPNNKDSSQRTDCVGSTSNSPLVISQGRMDTSDNVHDPVEAKETWTRLFTKPAAPRCEGHEEPCITLLTKKPGMNLGRSFWMCPRPIGPSGAKEKNTHWRCQTFIWCSDWNPNATDGG